MPSINELMVELTQACQKGNFEQAGSCTHCIRGQQSAGKTITKDVFDAFFENTGITYINTLMFTGGEPSLHPEGIMMFLQSAKEHGVSFDRWWISTNGLKHKKTTTFITAILELEMAAESKFTDDDCPRIQISTGHFHNHTAEQLRDIHSIWDCFSFVEWNDFSKDVKLFEEGFAPDFGYGGKNMYCPEDNSDSFRYEDECIGGDEPFYISYNGGFTVGCNFSYERFDEQLRMGSVFELKSIDDLAHKIFEYGESRGAHWECIFQDEELCGAA